jgi:predicted NUDIX family phosphoesterase
MEKTALQKRAESLALRFRASGRPALVVEFAGLPKAGKTTTLNQVYSFLRRCGFRCEVVVERASVCPVRDKKHFNFNIWTACTSLTHLIDKTQNPPRQDDPDILFLDRGIFDSLCWFSVLEKLARITAEDRSKVEEFLLIKDWTDRVSGVIVMTAESNDSLQREQGHLPVHGPGGSIMNPHVLRQMRSVIEDTTNRFRDRFKFFSIDTSSQEFSGQQAKTCEAAAGCVLDWVENSLEEQILSLSKNDLPDLNQRYVASGSDAANLLSKFESKGDFKPRSLVESDLSRIQPLPVVVVRNRSGYILRLVRKEREPSSRLNKKMTVWAGGHVHKEDGPGGKGAITTGATRELQEELRLYVEPAELNLLGVVYVTSSESARKHLAFVYEWRAQTDDVEVALCNSEFVERNGNSLSGSFVPVEAMMEEAKKGEILEEWSIEILQNLISHSEKRATA